MVCPPAEALALLAGAGGSPDARASLADHAATCESCHAVVLALVAGAGTLPTVPGGASDAPQALGRVGRYVLERRIGAGGMGVVYEASDPELGRRVAIKMLHRGAPAERLRREAQALARLAHPNVVTVHDVGEYEGQVFVAMALVEGDNLRHWLARGSHSTREILDVLVRAGRGVAAAHKAGLVHRDLKPDNIFVSHGGDVLVGDFGLAHDSSDGGARSERGLATAATQLTMTGTVLGTPAYMAPEQADGEATEASDQFSFCVTVFEALHGVRPFSGDTFEQLQTNIRAARRAEPRSARKLPARLGRALRRGLSANAGDRFPSMEAFIRAIEPRPGWVRRAWPIAAGLIVASVGMVLATRGSHGPSCVATRQELAATWNPTRRAMITSVLRERQVTPAAADEVADALDRYAGQWLTAREMACTAEADDRRTAEQHAARRSCLAARASELAGVIREIEGATVPDPLGLWQRISALSPPEACRDDATARLAVGGSDHAQLMLAIARLDPRTIDEGELDRLSARAEAANDRPALLAVELARGTALLVNHAAPQADVALQRALALAEQLGATSARIEALALLARSACKQGRFDASTPLLVMADADIAHDDATGRDPDVVMRARAECLYQLKDPAAIPLLRELIARAAARYGADSPRELDLRLQLGESYYSLGQTDDGAREIATFDRILARFVLPGAQAAEREEQTANATFLAGDLADAIDHQRRAVELWGADVNRRVGALSSLALMYELGTAWRLAATIDEEIAKLVPPGSGTNASVRVESLVQDGVMKLQVGELAQAAALFDQAADEARSVGRPELVNNAELGRGRVAVERGDFARGARILRDAIAVYLQRPDASAYQRGVARFALARALVETGDPTGATAIAAEAEADVAQGITDAKSNPLGSKLVPIREAMLARVTRWRDQHPSHPARDR